MNCVKYDYTEAVWSCFVYLLWICLIIHNMVWWSWRYALVWWDFSFFSRFIALIWISPLQSITRLRHHHSSCTVCLRAQYWGPFSSSCTLRLSLSDIIANHSVNHQLFADDTQLQKSAPLSEVTNLACTDDIKTWMAENQLKLNDDKTEALLFPFSSSLKPSTVPLPDSITLGSHNIPFSDSARNLGFILDSKLSMKKHVIKTCQTAYFELKRTSSIRRFLTEDATKTLVTSCILSRLDYCNCLLMGTPNSVIQPLLKIQNFAARLVLLAPRHHHSTPLLEKTALASHFKTY